MNSVIFRYELPVVGKQAVAMPRFAHVLHAGEQDGKLYVWAKVNPIESVVEREFLVANTGVDLPPDDAAWPWWFVRTVQMSSGLVRHVFTREAFVVVYG